MKAKKYVIPIGMLVLIFVSLSQILVSSDIIINSNSKEISPFSGAPTLSSGDNKAIIDSIFNHKISEYYDKVYFTQIYEPSLQATYYGLSILDTIGKLDQINQSEMVSYIMNHYSPSSFTFMDILAYRYLDSDFAFKFIPLSSVLEVNCYAVLSLDILDSIELIDTQEMIDFLWSCYNPLTSGFIGQPFYSGLEDEFKISTLDNTYFAIITLNLLMNDWTGYSTQKQELITYINTLQLSGGGFLNDDDLDFISLNPLIEPNLLVSYYAFKSLELFGMEDTIRVSDFHQFLGALYESEDHYFHISDWFKGVNYTNIVATALGLELSDISSYIGIDRTKVVNFILTHRNLLGNWDCSTTIGHHELIDTFQILRSLNGAQEISQLSTEDRNEIGNATLTYLGYQGFSLLSEDYTSMKLIHTITSAFSFYDRINDLEIQELYLAIKNAYNDFSDFGTSRYFYGYIFEEQDIMWFRSHPIEYYTLAKNNYIEDISHLNSHESTYYALESLQALFKLDDFGTSFNLMSLLNDIIATQFLNDSYYDTFGAFSYVLKYQVNYSEIIHKRVYCDYTYYAIKSLELLGTYFGLDLTDMNVDIPALYSYIDRNIIETPSVLYFNPRYSDQVEDILKATYYMMYVLEALDLNNKNIQKIETYITNNLDYSNIQNIYYSYKLSELLDLNINFDTYALHDLVQQCYSEEFYEFYLTLDKDIIDQEIFLWICDMARTSDIGIDVHYSNTAPLGGTNHMEVSLYNLILRDFGNYITFKFESDEVGSMVFSKLANNTYIQDIEIPISSSCYPVVDGYLRAYEGSKVKAESYIAFSTTYDLNYKVEYNADLSEIIFHINVSIIANGQSFPTSSGDAYTKVFRNSQLLGDVQASYTEFVEYSLFRISYTPSMTGQYIFELYLDDGISRRETLIETIPFEITEIAQSFNEEMISAIPLTVIFLAVPGVVIVFSSKQLKKLKNKLNS